MDISMNTMENLLLCAKERAVYLFGASSSAEKFISRNIGKLNIQGIFDNDMKKWGTKFIGLNVLAIDDLVNLDRENTVFIITSIYEDDIEEQLLEYDFTHIYSSHMCEQLIKSWLLPISEKDMIKVDKVKKLMSDNLSVERIEQIVKNRREKKDYWSGMIDGEAYFQDFFRSKKDEVFIDGGAYIGDTIDKFFKWSNGVYKTIYAFEPDKDNFSKLNEKYGNKMNIECFKAGLWSQNGTLRFNAVSTEASKVDNNGDEQIEVRSIDETVSEKVTFIKMDIEGSELEALKGARDTIIKYRPKLAICIYHKQDDLWNIPLYIHELVPEYKMYIRHHSLGCGDTVLYATCDKNN